MLAQIAGATSRLRVGTAVTVLPMRDPVYLAKQASTLDQLSAGCFMLGLGSGAYREGSVGRAAGLCGERRCRSRRARRRERGALHSVVLTPNPNSIFME